MDVFVFFRDLDRRWIFLLMAVAIALPLLFGWRFPEQETPLVRRTFEAVEGLRPGARVLLAFDFDPASEGELSPMATAFTRHCCELNRKYRAAGQEPVKLCFLALWPVGPQMIDDAIDRVIKRDFPQMVYGEDYVNLGFKPGNEGVIKVLVTDLRQLYTTDDRGTSIDKIPMCRPIRTVRDFDLIINISAGYPGTKEWVQYAATPYDILLVAGCTGVQAPLLYPYIPEQLPGLLGAIKGAAEYEKMVRDHYRRPGLDEARYQEGLRRMGPQLLAHLLMILLIIGGNVIFFMERRLGRGR